MTISDKEKQIILAALEHLRQTKIALHTIEKEPKPLNNFDIISYGHTIAMCLSLESKFSNKPIAELIKK